MEDVPHVSKTPDNWPGEVTRYRLDAETYVVGVRGGDGIQRYEDTSGNWAGVSIQGISKLTVYAGESWFHEFTLQPDGTYKASRGLLEDDLAPTDHLREALSNNDTTVPLIHPF
jgi:hypothetical protein